MGLVGSGVGRVGVYCRRGCVCACDLPIVRGLNLFFLGLSRRRLKLIVGGLNKKQKLIFRFEILKFKILKFFKFQILNFEIFKFKFDKNAAS